MKTSGKLCKSMKAAEEKAYQGENESEESQAALDRCRMEHGVGMTSSSPVPEDGLSLMTRKSQQILKTTGQSNDPLVALGFGRASALLEIPNDFQDIKRIGQEKQADAIGDATRYTATTTSTSTINCEVSQESNPPCGVAPPFSVDWQLNFHDLDVHVPEFQHVLPNVVIEAPSPPVKTDVLPQLPASSGQLQISRRMDDYTQSPTQSNDGRSYEQYFNPPSQKSTQPPTGNNDEGPLPDGSPEQRTLHEDDTGAVNFKHVSGHARSDFSQDMSLVQEESEGVAEDLFPRPHRFASSQEMPPPAIAPETPAVVQNPFLQKKGADLLDGSQLFGQVSSAVKKFSPTSSRPSPDVFHHDTISPNPPISSPLKDRGLRTSPTRGLLTSPSAFPPTSSRPYETGVTPARSGEDDLPPDTVPDSPQYSSPRTGRVRKVPEPLDDYEPMEKSQERMASVENLDQEKTSDLDDTDEREQDFQRRRRMRKKQDKVNKELHSINIRRSRSTEEYIEVPSTNRKKTRQSSTHSLAEDYVAQCHGINLAKDGDSQETVADSQDQPAGADSRPDLRLKAAVNEVKSSNLGASVIKTIGQSSDKTSGPSQLDHENSSKENLGSTEPQPVGSKELVPETSPPLAPVQTRTVAEILDQASSVVQESSISLPSLSSEVPPRDESGNASFPQLRARSQRVHNLHRKDIPSPIPVSKSSVVLGRDSGFSPKASAEQNEHATADISSSTSSRERLVRSSPPFLNRFEVIQPSSQASSVRRSSRLKPVITPAPSSSAPALNVPSGASSKTSTLSVLTNTPELSSSTTPATRDSPSDPSKSSELDNSSPVFAKSRRQGVTKLKTYSKLGHLRDRDFRAQSRRDSLSTDELAKSPASSAPPSREHSRAPEARKSTTTRQPGNVSITRGNKLFEGMAFAISFQSKLPYETQDKYKDRMMFSQDIEKRIQQAGGRILSEGFSELFETYTLKSAATSPVAAHRTDSLKLLPKAENLGFTALIADGHSRKAKYMQALALGLPTIAPKWITTCLNRNELVEWDPYLLCAGQSSHLGDAIRSRSLRPYPAATSSLAEVLSDRPKLLDGSDILLLMKKSRNEDKKMPYVFLAHVLGANLIRVHTLEEARAKLAERESLGQPFDWVYLDEGMSGVKEQLFGIKQVEQPGKKRKRQKSGQQESEPPPKRVRTLYDELVIQSLILGTLIDEDDMGE